MGFSKEKPGEAPVTPSILLCCLPTFPVFQGLRFPASRWKFHLEHGDQAQASLGFDIPADCFSRPPDPAPRESRVQRSNKSSGRFISSQNSSIFLPSPSFPPGFKLKRKNQTSPASLIFVTSLVFFWDAGPGPFCAAESGSSLEKAGNKAGRRNSREKKPGIKKAFTPPPPSQCFSQSFPPVLHLGVGVARCLQAARIPGNH